MATDYTLNIVFADRQFQQLHRVNQGLSRAMLSLMVSQAGYNVCISKLVNGKYNVVWSSQTYVTGFDFISTATYGLAAFPTITSSSGPKK